jgi:hypothetical protein
MGHLDVSTQSECRTLQHETQTYGEMIATMRT